jgi:hypothetical protein
VDCCFLQHSLATHGFPHFLPGRRKVSGSLARTAAERAIPPGSLALDTLSRKSHAGDGGKCDSCDDEFFHFVWFVEVDSRFPLPCHRRPWHHAANGAVDPKGIMDPAGREKARYGDRSHHGFVGIGEISRTFFDYSLSLLQAPRNSPVVFVMGKL